MRARDGVLAVAEQLLVLSVVLVLTVTFGAKRGLAADETLLLEVTINGTSTGKIGEFTLRDGALFARPAELADVGLRVPKSVPETQDGLIALSLLEGISTRLDQTTQTLHVTAPNDSLLPSLLQSGAGAPSGKQVESGIGTTFNYDIVDTAVGGQNVASGLLDLRTFSPWGVLSSDALVYAGASPSGPGGYSAIRLDSTYVYSDPDTLRRYRLGDLITGGLSWTRPVRLGGGQINSDFSMRPDLVTFPLPSVGGTVAVPSTVDVLINGTQLFSRQIQPGPFQIPQLPVVTGAGTVAMTVTDALGRQVTTTLPFYASSSLLAPGLQSYSAELGMVRLNWGFLSNDYQHLAGSATYRRGVSSDITIEAHLEGTTGTFMTGGGLVANLFDLGVLNLTAAGSSGAGHSGALFSLGAQRIGHVISLAASATVASRNFRDIAAMNGDPVPLRQINANAGLSLGRFGSFGVAYAGIDRAAAPAPVQFLAPNGSLFTQQSNVPGGTVSVSGNVVTFQPERRAQILSGSYSLQVGNLSFFATGFHDFANTGSSGVLFGLTVPLGGRSSISAGAGTNSGAVYAQVQAVQSPVSIGDWGYQIYGAAGTPTHEFAQAQYKSRWALVSAGVDRTGKQTAIRAEGQGAVSYVDDGLFASNAINDSFAVVDTNGAKDIVVYDENREVGRTDSAGQLLLPDLRSFDLNHISIEPTDLPADATVPFVARDVRPQDRSGVVVRFPVKTSHGALVQLVDESNRPVEVGSSATLAETGVTVPVGYDGAAFVEDLKPGGNQLNVQIKGGKRCVAAFDYLAVPGEIPTIGPVPCR